MESWQLGTRIAIRSRPPKHFGILIDEPARAPHGPYLEKVRKNKTLTMGNPLLQETQNWNFTETELSPGGGGRMATHFRARALPNFRLSKKLIY